MKTLDDLKKSQNNILILHYACTDINKSPVIVTSISIKDYSLGQTFSFSFDEYESESKLLSEFVKHMQKYQNHIVVTWNQKSSTYGVQHLQRRCQELEASDKFPIKLENVIDLDDIFVAKYGRNYTKDPKLRNLAQLNEVTLQNFVDGIDEIKLFNEKEYKKIENSTNRKVGVIADCLILAFHNKLKTNSPDSSALSKTEGEEMEKKKPQRRFSKTVIIAIGVIAGIIAIITGIIVIYEFAEERAGNVGDDMSTPENTPDTLSPIESQEKNDNPEKPFLSLQIISHTDLITEQKFPAIIYGNGTVIHKPSTISRGPIPIYENLTSKFSLYVHNDGPGIVTIDWHVVKVISDDKTLQPVTITGEPLGKLLEPNDEAFEISAQFVGNPRMKPSGII